MFEKYEIKLWGIGFECIMYNVGCCEMLEDIYFLGRVNNVFLYGCYVKK